MSTPKTLSAIAAGEGAESNQVVAAEDGKRIVVYGYQLSTDADADGFFKDSDGALSLRIFGAERGGAMCAYCPSGIFQTGVGKALEFEQTGGNWSVQVQYSVQG